MIQRRAARDALASLSRGFTFLARSHMRVGLLVVAVADVDLREQVHGGHEAGFVVSARCEHCRIAPAWL